MSTLEECKANMAKLKERLAEYVQQMKDEPDAQKRQTLKVKISTYRASIKDMQVQIDYLDPPEVRKARKEQRKRYDIGSCQFDWFERSGKTWADIEGHTWNQLESGDVAELGTDMKKLQEWLAEGSQRLTKKQRLYIDAYYNQGLSMDLIAEQYNTCRSTVSRVIRNGMARMQEWVDAKKLIYSCIDADGGFNWERYLSEVPVLTDRQRQLMLLILSEIPKTQDELSAKLDLKQSTISRTLSKAANTIQKLDVVGGRPTSRPDITCWQNADKFSLALDTNMPRYFYYRFCFRDQMIGGISRYNYELLRRMEANITPKEAAKELGMKPKTVRSAYGKLKKSGITSGHLAAPDDRSIGMQMDAETYVKIQRMVTGYAGT